MYCLLPRMIIVQLGIKIASQSLMKELIKLVPTVEKYQFEVACVVNIKLFFLWTDFIII